jgi:hypothetical protein
LWSPWQAARIFPATVNRTTKKGASKTDTEDQSDPIECGLRKLN